MKRIAIAVGCIALLLVSALGAVTRAQAREATASRTRFSHPLVIDNHYFPLVAGTTFIYEGTEDNKSTYEEFVVTDQTRVIQGIEARVVHDTNWTNGKLTEDTFDWYAQDDPGNVWYLGEDSTQYKNGKVIGHEGSWEAGVNGASAGIVMEARPRVGDSYQQEDAPGVAEDAARVLSLDESLCVTLGCYSNVLLTEESSPLDPGVLEDKYYAAGVGQIKGVVTAGGQEESELVSIVTP